MFSKQEPDPLRHLRSQPEGDRRSGILILALGVVFAVATAGLLVLRPGVAPPEDRAFLTPGVTADRSDSLRTLSGSSAPSHTAGEPQVARAATPTLSVAAPAHDRNADVAAIVSAVLAQFAGETGYAMRLNDLTTQSVLNQHSDTHVDMVLNSAVKRENLNVPAALRTPAGGLDAHAFLTGILEATGNAYLQPVTDISARGTHVLKADDSLAGLAMRYYGKPLMYRKIVEANPKLDPVEPKLILGDTLNIPGL